MDSRSGSSDRARALEARLRSELTALALADAAAEGGLIRTLEAGIAALEALHIETSDALPWPVDARARMEDSLMTLERLREGRIHRRDAVTRIRLLLPRFPRP